MVTPEHHVALVDHLVRYSKPVRRILPIRVRLAAFLILWSATAALVAWACPRPDLMSKLHDASFTIGLAALALATSFTTLLALRCAVPGRAPSRLEMALAIGLVGAAALSFWPQATVPSITVGWRCGIRTLATAALPWGLLLIAIRRGAPVRVASAAVYAGAAATLLATTVLRSACPENGGSHWLVWHLGAAPFATCLLAPIANAWLRSWRHDEMRPPL